MDRVRDFPAMVAPLEHVSRRNKATGICIDQIYNIEKIRSACLLYLFFILCFSGVLINTRLFCKPSGSCTTCRLVVEFGRGQWLRILHGAGITTSQAIVVRILEVDYSIMLSHVIAMFDSLKPYV